MVNPVVIIAITLMAAFSIGIFQFFGKKFVRGVFWLTILFDFSAVLSIAYGFLTGKITKPIMVKIGGFPPPIGINLSVDRLGAYLAVVIFFIGTMAAYHWLSKGVDEPEPKALVLMLLLLLGSTGMIFTQDFFNLFVFIEITSIASYGLVASNVDWSSLEASFKYIVIGSISSTFVLLGAVLLYKFGGSLNMTDISSKIAPSRYGGVLMIIAIMFLFGLLIELELFPMNGWALDIYQGANPAVVAILAGGIVKGFYLVFVRSAIYLKFPYILKIGLIFGLTTYLVSQFFAWKQKDIRRLFGYSSVGQLGLLVLAGGFYVGGGLQGIDKTYMLLAIVFFVLNHSFSKSTLFFLADLIGEKNIEKWKGVLKSNKLFKTLFSTSVLSMAGAPPFIGFWAKLFFILAIPRQYFYVVVLVLIGAVAEITYYFNLYRITSSDSENSFQIKGSIIPASVNTLVLIGLSFLSGYYFFLYARIAIPTNLLIMMGAAIIMYVFGFSRIIQWILSLGILGYTLYLFKNIDINLQGFFLLFILLGGVVLVFATYPVSKKYSWSFYPLLIFSVLSMVGIAQAKEWISLFIFWEIMSWSSYLIINQGSKAKKASWVYLVMSAIGGYAMLSGIKLLTTGPNLIPGFGSAAMSYSALASILIFTAFLVKMATSPVHIWAKEAYGESPDGFTPILSGILSKMGVFGAILTIVYLIPHTAHSNVILYGLALFGALTALFMALLAVFQENVKKVLAYSSVSQVGYILIGIALASSLGYSAALYHTVNHLIFKGLLFVAVAGIIYRTGTSYLPEMGGLIRRMPITFLAFLMGIITLAGIPPLSGFAGKWLLYSALLEKKWMFILLIAMFASIVAFMYCYKLLHTIFLGQLRDKYRKTKEVPLPIIIVELIFAGLTMAVGMKPSLILDFSDKVIKSLGFFNPGYAYEGAHRIVSKFGYWNAYFMSVFAIGAFIIALVLFLLVKAEIRKVGQLDIGYSGEVPDSPESVHFGYDLYAHMRRAVLPFISPVIENSYKKVYNGITAFVDYARRFYTGDLSTYAMWVIITLSFIFYIFYKGVF
jgi:formate hydrogenlyase subunit 3/multisubunit Na+/H+ antiporter MnhD subunit